MDFCNNLKHFRLAMGCTQKEMAAYLGITERGYRNYEIGAREPSLSDLVRIADKLNVSLDALVGRDSPQDSLVDAE
jgi:transcriptional regulator with XRE-family HTH domain